MANTSTTPPNIGPPLPKKKGRPFQDRHILDELKAIGVTRPYVAGKIKEVFEEGGAKEKLVAGRMYLALTGDIKDERSGAVNVTATGPIMVIVGANTERMNALRKAIPQISAEQLEEERAARTEKRLAQLRSGELEPICKHSKAKGAEDAEVESIDVESRTVECGEQVAVGEGRPGDLPGHAGA